jgi:hypothetical protein
MALFTVLLTESVMSDRDWIAICSCRWLRERIAEEPTGFRTGMVFPPPCV